MAAETNGELVLTDREKAMMAGIASHVNDRIAGLYSPPQEVSLPPIPPQVARIVLPPVTVDSGPMGDAVRAVGDRLADTLERAAETGKGRDAKLDEFIAALSDLVAARDHEIQVIGGMLQVAVENVVRANGEAATAANAKIGELLAAVNDLLTVLKSQPVPTFDVHPVAVDAKALGEAVGWSLKFELKEALSGALAEALPEALRALRPGTRTVDLQLSDGTKASGTVK